MTARRSSSVVRGIVCARARVSANARTGHLGPRQTIRMIASSRHVCNTSHDSSTPPHFSSSGNRATQSTSGGKVDGSMRILLESIPHIPQYGFTKQAYLRSGSTDPLDTEEMGRRLRTVETLFPGPEAAFEGKLFEAWNRVCDLAVLRGLTPEAVLHALQSGHEVNSGADETRGRPVSMRRLSDEQEKTALNNVARMIEDRLRSSWTVKRHLTQGITSLSTLSPTTTSLHSIFPHQTLLPNLPTPLPLLNMTSAFISTVLTHPSTGYLDPDGPDWYAVRTRFTFAYTTATLHAASSSIHHFQDTQRLFWRIVEGRETGLGASVGRALSGAGDWVGWGGRGWLGVLRSLGL